MGAFFIIFSLFVLICWLACLCYGLGFFVLLASLFVVLCVSFFASMCVGVFLCLFAWGTLLFGLQGRCGIFSLFLRLESFDLVPAVA